MQLGVERNNNSLYVFDALGETICYLPNIFAKENQRAVLKTLSIFFKHFKTEVDKHGKQTVTKPD